MKEKKWIGVAETYSQTGEPTGYVTAMLLSTYENTAVCSQIFGVRVTNLKYTTGYAAKCAMSRKIGATSIDTFVWVG